jgi:hypothetical protein
MHGERARTSALSAAALAQALSLRIAEINTAICQPISERHQPSNRGTGAGPVWFVLRD